MKRALLLLLLMATLCATAQTPSSQRAYAQGVELYEEGRYAEAIPLFQTADSLDALFLPEGSAAAEYPNVWMASCYYHIGDTVRPRELYPNAYMLPPVDRRLVQEGDALCDDAFACIDAGDYESALRLLEQAGAIEQKVLGKRHYYYGNTLSLCAQMLTELGRYDEAITNYEQAVSILADYDFHYGLASCFIDIANVYVAMGSIDRATEFYDKALPLLDALEPTLEVADLWYGASLFFVDYYGDCYAALGCMQRCYEIADACAPHDGMFFADACYGMGATHCAVATNICAVANNNADTMAIEAYQTAFTYSARADSLYRLLEYTDSQRFAENLYYMALSGCKSDQPGHQDIVREAFKLWQSEEMEPFSGTLTYYQMMRLYVQCTPDTLPYETTIEALHTMADELFTSDDVYFHLLGLDMLTDILTILQYDGGNLQLLHDNTFLLDQIGQRLDSLPNISAYERAHYYLLYAKTLNQELNENERAINVLLHAKVGLEMEGSDTTHVYRQVLSQLGQICTNIERYDEAFSYYSQFMELGYASLDYHTERMKELGMNEREYAEALDNISYYLNATGDFQRSDYFATLANIFYGHNEQEALFSAPYILYCLRNGKTDDALSMFRQFFDSAYTDSCSDLERFAAHVYYALVLILTGDHFAEAEQQFDLASKQEVTEYLPIDHVAVILYELLRSFIAIQHGDLATAEQQLKNAAATVEASDNINASTLNTLYEGLRLIHQQLGNKEGIAEDIRRKTEILTQHIRTTFRSMNYAERTAFWNQYAQWFTATLPATAYTLQRADIDTLLYNATLMSKGLLLNSEIEVKRLITAANDPATTALYDSLQLLYNERKQLSDYNETYAQLNRDIEAGERKLVSLVKSYGDYTRNLTLTWHDVQAQLGSHAAAVEFVLSPISEDSLMYSALVLTSDAPPQRVDLCSEQQLKAIPGEDLYSTPALAGLIWQPLAQTLQGIDTVYFAPQGLLYSTAIEYVPIDDNGTYIADRYTLFRLSSTRELAISRPPTPTPDAVLYGGLHYDADSTTVSTANRQTANAAAFRSGPDWTSLRGGATLSDLQYTLAEVEDIAELCRQQGDSCYTFKGNYGTEENFKRLSGTGRTLLHVATHGFYYTEQALAPQGYMNQLLATLGNSLSATEDKALTLSGLFLAGANQALTGTHLPIGQEDGVLTAQEISLLDLRNVDLVVLSACETALGQMGGDGVFGLQRGFKKAGAHSLLMSLWKVEDQATRQLMTDFYRYWLGGKSKREALRMAQDNLRSQSFLSDDWAAFILLDGLD